MGGHYPGKAWLALNLDSKKGWGSSPFQHYQTTYMCGDKWANIFCQTLHSKPRGSCLHWKPMIWLSQVGLMSRRNGRGADRCVSALFVCVLYCGTMVVRPLNTSGHGGVWPRVDRVWGWWESSPGVGEAGWSQTETRGPQEARARPTPALTHSLFFLASYPGFHRNTCYRI